MGGVAKLPGRGRKAKPTARKEAAGNPGKRALNKDEPDFGLVTNVEPPEWIQGIAREMWERVTPLLCQQRILQLSDIHIVEGFCIAYGNWRAAQDHVNKNGIVIEGATGGPIKNPALTELNAAAKQMVMFGGQLGLDPVSRQRLTGGSKGKSDNPFGALVNG
jgi:P27 family predicted phage terminase small subunit